MSGKRRTPWLGLACAACFALLPALGRSAEPSTPVIGVYYYGGWHTDPAGFGFKDPWKPIQPFPERKPLIGWYDGASKAVLQQQATQMQHAGIGFVAFDWFYEKGGVQIDQPIRLYETLGPAKPKFALLWANHGGHTSGADWKAIVGAWRTRYLADPAYFKIDGRNVVFVFSAQRLADDAAAAGASVKQWIGDAQVAMAAAGLPPIYFVAGVVSADETIVPAASADGFSAISAYNLRKGPGDQRLAHGYAELDDAYRRQWTLMAKRRGHLEIVTPMTSGWDRRPWGGSKDPLMDHSTSSVPQFRAHLAAGKAFMAAESQRYGVICCWNEFGEGSIIEPTAGDQGGHLDAVKAVFGSGR